MELTQEELDLLSQIIIARMSLIRTMFGSSPYPESQSIAKYELEKLQDLNTKICEAMK